MMRDVQNIIDKGLLKTPYYIDLVLGMRYQGACDATPKIFLQMIDLLPPGTIVNCAAVGRAQLPLTTLSDADGRPRARRPGRQRLLRQGRSGHQRPPGARTVRIIRELGKEPATPAEAREILGLKPL